MEEELLGDRSVVLFVYHRFGDDRFPSTNIGIAEFRKHLEFLQSNNYSVMTLSDALAYLKRGENKKKVAVITIDDGYKSFQSGAMPLLQEFKMPATLFINTETVGSYDYLNWKELKELQGEGIEIGNHSHSHAYFLNYPEQERGRIFREDVVRAQDLMKEHLGLAPRIFAYPYGEYDPEMKGILSELGFDAAVAQNSGVMFTGGDQFAIPRFPMSDSYAAGFAEKVKMKPLKVFSVKPEAVLLGDQNPPVLEVTFKNDSIRAGQLQCFVQYGKCSVEVLSSDPLTVKLRATDLLKHRRTLYTLTAPSLAGEWHWYSHLWVIPDVKGSDRGE
ncbi:Polysaccharide deacetylase [Fulvivirga imtechensis AK7]|uniref:Polysaccharide deacetylase n=1 Tax=Fulvivirga imtechensis AK7 TaxID=1237149 RepID=L8JXH2_9BACT